MNRRLQAEQHHPELERLICAAVSNQHFATHLLTAPEEALALSSHGSQLSPREQALIISIGKAADIYDFAARLHASVRQPE